MNAAPSAIGAGAAWCVRLVCVSLCDPNSLAPYALLMLGMIALLYHQLRHAHHAHRAHHAPRCAGQPDQPRPFRSAPALVDFVYTWVNGSAPSQQRALADALRAKQLTSAPHPARRRDDGLLQYALLSLLAADSLLSGSIRHVYIVSAGEEPSFLSPLLRDAPAAADDGKRGTWRSVALTELVRSARGRAAETTAAALAARGSRLYIVPHKDIFPAPADLPTFNSNAVLAALHHLPGLGARPTATHHRAPPPPATATARSLSRLVHVLR